MLSEQAQDRFWAKVKGDKEDACWLWQGAVSTSGYGNLRADKVYRRAHRTAYELCHGNIPDGMCVMHSCDVKLCCNPAHLSVGTLAENTRDAAEKGLLSVKKPMLSGERNHNTSLNADDVKRIRELYAAGIYQKHIGAMFGVSQTCVSSIVRRNTWAHVE